MRPTPTPRGWGRRSSTARAGTTPIHIDVVVEPCDDDIVLVFGSPFCPAFTAAPWAVPSDRPFEIGNFVAIRTVLAVDWGRLYPSRGLDSLGTPQ